MARRRLDRVALLVVGVLAGFLGTFLVVYLYVNAARTRVVEERVRVALGLPEQAFRLEDVEPDGSLRILLRDVAFLDRNRDTIVASPVVRARLLAGSLAGDGPIVFDEGEVVRPRLSMVQDARGEWNVFQIFAVEARGQPVRRPDAPAADEESSARPLVFRNLRVVDGRARIATPSTPPRRGPPARYASGGTPEVVRYRGRWLNVHYVNDLDVTLGMVRVGGSAGWRVEIARASARVTNPDTRIEALAGWFEDRGDKTIRFDLQTFRTPYSSFDGEGSIATGGPAPRYDVRLRAHPLDLRDLAGMGFPVPREGTARFALAIETLAGSRTRWTVTDADVAVLDSRVSGRLTAVTAPGAEPVFSGTRLTLSPLRLRDLETLGFAQDLPVAGELRGTVASLDVLEAGRGGPLRVELAATLTPKTTRDVPPSSLTARGLVRFGPAGVRFDGLRVSADPVHLALFADAAPAQRSLLRGTLRGGATLSGTLAQLRISGGDLAFAVGAAPETRLTGLSGELSLGDGMRYRIEARAEPLALGTLTELFPALPFRSATLAGPIRLSGTDREARFDVDLEGAAGALEARGTLAFSGAAPRFDVSGRMEAFRPGALLTTRTPVEGPLTGTFAARGTTEDFRFDVNMAAGEGRFTLGGTVRRPGGGPAVFDVAGRVDQFQLGLLLGRPDLLPGPVSGPIRLAGGGGQPYRFDVGLRGPRGALDLEGWYQPGTVPRYAVSGAVGGLDLSGLPLLSFLPRSRVTGTVSVEGRGTTLETFVGRIDLNLAAGSTVGGLPLQAGVARVSSDGNVLRVDTLLFAVRGGRLEARGALGITRPAETPLAFALDVPNLAAVRPLVPGSDTLPDLAGSLLARGSVGGTIRMPTFAATGQARGFRYGKYAAGSLDFDARGVKEPVGWTASAKLEGTGLESGTLRLQALTLEGNASRGRASFGLAARRDPQTDLTAAGTLELVPGGLTVQGAILDQLTLRVAGTEWRLAERARLGWAAERGLQVENLLLRRTGAGSGFLAMDGTIPPRGSADFRLHAEGIDLAEAHRIFPAFPDARGLLRIDATLHGTVDDPRLAVDARVDSLRFGGALADSVHVVANYAAGRLEASAGVRVGAREVLAARATVPMTLTLGGIVPGFDVLEEGPLTATIAADSVPLGLVAATLPRYVENAEGVLRAQVEVRGTPGDPQVSGGASVEGGALTVVPLKARWHSINGRLSLSGNEIRIDSVRARSGDDGHAFLNGTVRLDDPTRPLLDLALSLDDFRVVDNPELAEAEADARLRVTGNFPGAALTGRVEINDAVIYLPEFGAEQERDIVAVEVGALGADTATAPQGTAALLAAFVPRDLRIDIGDNVWLESPEARIQIASGDEGITVDRPPGSEVPLIYGAVQAVRGTYTLEVLTIEREFEVVEGEVRFYGTPELNPALDITAAHEVRSGTREEPLTVLVHVTGTMQNPQVELTSDTRPPLPQSELAELLVFGRRFEELEGLPDEITRGIFFQEAIGNWLAGQIERTLIKTGFVDYVRVRTSSAAASVGASGASASTFGLGILGPVSIEAGKEVVSNVFASLQLVDVFSGNERIGGAVDWEVTRRLRLRAAYEPVRRDPLVRREFNRGNQITVDARARWEYGRPKVQADIGPSRRRRDPDQPEPGKPSTPTGEPAPPPPPEGPQRDERRQEKRR